MASSKCQVGSKMASEGSVQVQKISKCIASVSKKAASVFFHAFSFTVVYLVLNILQCLWPIIRVSRYRRSLLIVVHACNGKHGFGCVRF